MKKTCEDTSKSCLINLVEAGVNEAILLNEYLGFKPQTSNKKIAKASALFQEIRYRFINYYIKKSGFKNILDIGCGYSPRTIEFLPKGYKYVGIELPEVVEAVNNAQNKCLDDKYLKNVKYESVKLVDTEGLIKAAECFDGPVCIVVEGVFMYFTKKELEKTLTAFKHILKKNGGCLITPDFVTNMMMKHSFTSFAGPILGNLMLKASYIVLKKCVQKTDDPYMDPLKQFKDDSDSHAEDFFNSMGFNIERVPLYTNDMPMSSFKTLDDKTLKAKERLSRLYGWVVKVKWNIDYQKTKTEK